MATELIPIEDLDRNILSLSQRINAATYELLVLIREFDERCGWLKWGLQNCAEWLAWRCDFSMTTALEKVRVAHALKGLPAIAQSFATGELSYTKVRALTRVADRQNEDALLAFALRQPATHVAQRCRELRCGTEASTDVAARAFANRSLRLRRDHQRGTMTVTVELPIETGELLEKALDKARDDDCLAAPDLADTAWSTRQADALLNVIRRYLHGHHVEHWSNNGETRLENLLLLCTKHHTLVHEGGFRIQRDFRHRWYFTRPDGIAVPDCGYTPADTVDDGASDDHALPPAGGLLSDVKNTASEPAAPVYWH